jgi:hypothetical protein
MGIQNSHTVSKLVSQQKKKKANQQASKQNKQPSQSVAETQVVVPPLSPDTGRPSSALSFLADGECCLPRRDRKAAVDRLDGFCLQGWRCHMPAVVGAKRCGAGGAGGCVLQLAGLQINSP